MKKIPPYIRVLVIFFFVFGAMEYFIDSGNRPAFIQYPMVSVFLFVFLFLLVAIEITMSAVDNIMYQLLTEEEKIKLNENPNRSITDSNWYKKLVGFLVRPESSVVSEDQLLLEHDYDGIKELDNNLPPWWVYLFYATVLFAGIYLVRFHMLGADNQALEYTKSVEEAKLAVAEYQKSAPDLMTKDKVTLLTDKESLAQGKAIFQNTCVACHRADAGGQIGPNLTDDMWINGGGIKNVFNVIMEGGRDGKGMQAWKSTIKPTDIQKIASYVLSLQGSNPKDPKPTEPEAKKWVEEGAPAATPADAKATDSTKVADATPVKK